MKNFLNTSSSFNDPYVIEGKPETLVATMGMTSKGYVTLRIKNHKKINSESSLCASIPISKVKDFLLEKDVITEADIKAFDKYTHYIDLDGKISIMDAQKQLGTDRNLFFTPVKRFMWCDNPDAVWTNVYIEDSNNLHLTDDHPLRIKYEDSDEFERIRVKDIDMTRHPKVICTRTNKADSDTPRAISIERIEIDTTTEIIRGYDFETESDTFLLNDILSHNCRTRVIGNVYDPSRQISYARGNLFPTTLNLPYVALEAQEYCDAHPEEDKLKKFYEILDERMEDIFGQLMERFEIIARRKAKNYPFLMGQGIYLDSEKLHPDDEIREVLKHGTLVTGFIGLAETLKVLTGKHHGESQESWELGYQIIEHMNQKCTEQAQKTKMNFSFMGSPAESCCGRLLQATRKRFGVIPGVTDHEYLTNSHHIPVYFPISAYEKARLEGPFHKLEPAGAISYVELDSDTSQNPEAFEELVTYMAECDMGYFSINHPVDRDPVCGYVGIIGDTCPRCGRRSGEGVPASKLLSLISYNPDPSYVIRFTEDEEQDMLSNPLH